MLSLCLYAISNLKCIFVNVAPNKFQSANYKNDI